ncbi:MAG: septum site-determining protein MinD [Clostridiales Family XIII bacterium]|jgi:septum site-determining protein MinD|nr:septum site-determining protein MinD [Clostridiales Family XIII bacterium]
MGKVIIIASGKGGVGKTVFAVNTGAALAKKGRKVVLIDMNVGLRNLDLCMGLESKVIFDIADVLSGVCKPKRALVRDKRFPCLYIMAAPQKTEKFQARSENVKALYENLRESFDEIIVDGPAGVRGDLRLASFRADMGIVVTTLDHVALRDADMVNSLMREEDVRERAYVINKVNMNLMRTGCLPSFEDVSRTIKSQLLGIIQYDENIHLASNCGYPIAFSHGNYIEENFGRIAERII